MYGHLGIIPCTKSKIWDFIPNIGSVQAICTYTGPEFVLSNRYISPRVERMVIFSAKYGFLDPWDIISEFYDVTFSRAEDPFIDIDSLKKQAKNKGLLNFKAVTAICNIHYQQRINEVFTQPDTIINCPVKGLVNEEDICMVVNKLIMNETSSPKQILKYG